MSHGGGGGYGTFQPRRVELILDGIAKSDAGKGGVHDGVLPAQRGAEERAG